MIAIDTAVMRDLVAASTSANSAITDAVEALNRISTHNDWACKEKNAINEYTNTNKARIRQLQESANSFLGTISGATTEFEETETSIAEMFSSVESMLSNIFSIATAIVAPIGAALPISDFPSNFVETIKDVLKNNLLVSRQDGFNPFEAFEVSNLAEPLATCHFSDINFR